MRKFLLGVGVVAIASACGAREAGELGSGDAGGEAPQDLSGELLSVDDLGGEWDSAGPEEIDVSEVGDEVTGPCPDGETVTLPDVERNLGAPGNATITFEAVDGTDMLLIEELSHDPTGELFDAYRQAFDACVGEHWEQTGRDGMENVKFETMDPIVDGAVGYRLLWGTHYDRQDLYGLARVDDVSLSLYLNGDMTDDPLGEFPEALAAAVANLKDGDRTDPVDEPSTTTTSESPDTTETASSVFPDDLRLGDCFDDSAHGTPELGEITLVDCRSPHDAEVFGVPTLPGEPGAPYPGDDEIDSLSYELCLGEFATFVGIDFLDSMWEFSYLLPTEESWRKYDDRLVICTLNDPSFNKIEGSKRGTMT